MAFVRQLNCGRHQVLGCDLPRKALAKLRPEHANEALRHSQRFMARGLLDAIERHRISIVLSLLEKRLQETAVGSWMVRLGVLNFSPVDHRPTSAPPSSTAPPA